ncbi:MAG: sulfurtransferase TusA family protein [Treponema sp.]
MEKYTVDARGRSCPEPVVMTKKALEGHSSFDVLVDCKTAKENITRFCEDSKVKTDISETQDGWKISVSK